MKVVLKDIKKTYKERTVLDIESLEFEKGKLYALLGPNGSGKTTMLRIMSRIEQQDSGVILYDNSVAASEYEISYLPQETYLFDTSVIRNMTTAIGKDKDLKSKAIEALRNVNMESFASAHARALSGGEAQRVAIARILALGKKLVLLDEPAASIDNISSALVEDYISRTNKKTGATVIFSTHNPSQALRIADEAVIMWNGRVIEKGRPSVVFNSPGTEETRSFLQNWRL